MICPVCGRDCPDTYMSKHHLRTRKVDKNDTEYLCRDCHGFIHALFGNKQLADPESNLDTIDGLMAHAEYRGAVNFIRKVPIGRQMRIRESRQRHRR